MLQTTLSIAFIVATLACANSVCFVEQNWQAFSTSFILRNVELIILAHDKNYQASLSIDKLVY